MRVGCMGGSRSPVSVIWTFGADPAGARSEEYLLQCCGRPLDVRESGSESGTAREGQEAPATAASLPIGRHHDTARRVKSWLGDLPSRAKEGWLSDSSPARKVRRTVQHAPGYILVVAITYLVELTLERIGYRPPEPFGLGVRPSCSGCPRPPRSVGDRASGEKAPWLTVRR